ncbi:MAG: type II toxin-antitoxin system HicB family antitoxin [Chloroflexota bacterium]|nr:type II toxin-antitoxin system HicB family antitoxin [Chloroflexota bacterium]
MGANREDLQDLLAREYPFTVESDPGGGYVILFPDLPGCLTQVESLDEVEPMATEIQQLWIETEFYRGNGIPLPSMDGDATSYRSPSPK